MSTHKNIDLICVVVTVLAIVLTVLFMNGERLGIEKIVDEDSENSSGSVYFTNNDLNGTWDSARATKIVLKGESASVSGSGAYVYNGDVIINGTGLFVVSGTLDDGSIIVDAHKSSKVWVRLDGADIRCSDSAAFHVRKADKVFLTLADGSENRIESGSEFSQEALDENVKGALFARDDLTINGSGALTVVSGYRHAIAANDDLVITGGTITAEAPRDAIHANDSFRLCDAALTLKGGDDGIDVDKENGYFFMTSGSVSIECADDGVSAEGDVLITGGELTVAAVDDGIHSKAAVYLYGGTVLLSECYEGIEGIAVELWGGDVTIYPFDDGVSANGNVLNGYVTLPPAADETAARKSDTYVRIAGGRLTIINRDAQNADGIDSNGSIYVTGGDVRISLPAGGTNNAINYGVENGGTARISGGTVIACGSYASAESFAADSEQCSILYNVRQGVDAGSDAAIRDQNGDVLLYWKVPGSFSSAVFSAPSMKQGESCTVVIGAGEETITLTDASASFGDVQSCLFGGKMNWGGLQPSGGFGEGFTPPTDGNRPAPTEGEPPEEARPELPDIRPQTVEETAAAAAQTVDPGVILTMIGASTGVLMLGLAFAALFRKKIDL